MPLVVVGGAGGDPGVEGGGSRILEGGGGRGLGFWKGAW